MDGMMLKKTVHREHQFGLIEHAYMRLHELIPGPSCFETERTMNPPLRLRHDQEGHVHGSGKWAWRVAAGADEE